MLRLNVTRATPAPEGPEVDPTPVTSGPGGELGGLSVDDIVVGGPTGSASAKTLNGLATPATWFTGTDGLSLKPYQPVLPLESVNVTASDTALRGALFLGGSYQDTPNTTPLTAAPATELRGIHSRFHTDVFFPPQPWTANYFGALSGSGNTQLHVTPVQHRSESPTMTLRKFTNMSFRLFYSNNRKLVLRQPWHRGAVRQRTDRGHPGPRGRSHHHRRRHDLQRHDPEVHDQRDRGQHCRHPRSLGDLHVRRSRNVPISPARAKPHDPTLWTRNITTNSPKRSTS